MILTGKEIEKRLGKDIIIEPFDKKKLNPNSYNLSLHDTLYGYVIPYKHLDMKEEQQLVSFTMGKEGTVLIPGTLYLGRTNERTITHNLVPMIEGRSSIGRLGMFIHITAGFGDVGFNGFWTLEISVIQPLKIYPNIDICQIFYHTVLGEIEEYKSEKYQFNQGVQPSMIYKELNK